MSSKIELTKPKDEDWNHMFKNVSVKDKIAKLETGIKAQKVEVEKLPPSDPSGYAPSPAIQHIEHGESPRPPPRSFPLPSSARSNQAGGEGYDEIDALVAGMNFDANAPERSGKFCTKCYHSIAKGEKILKVHGKSYHTDCWACKKCSVKLGTGEYFEHEKEVYCNPCYKATFRPKCTSCNDAIMESECTVASGQRYHTYHFVCAKCTIKLADDYFPKDGKVYCPRDYADLFCPKCSSCTRPVAEKYIHTGDVYFHLGCFICSSCKNEIGEGKYAEVNGKFRCTNCRDKP